jgi:hypothetical protein
MLAVSLGQAVGLVDEGMNIPQPAMTVEEFASSERTEHASLLQLNRHIIQLRQLEHQILASVHTRSHVEISNLSSLDRIAVSKQLRSAVDEWYSVGCLVCLPEADNIPIHSTITWLNARYYNLLILLYYPCHFNDQCKHNSTLELLGSIRKYFKYNHILLENKQLPLNYITLNRLIPACLALIHCFGVIQPCNFVAKSELSNCIDILHVFPKDWHSAHRAKEIATDFLNIVSTHEVHAAAQLISFTESDTMPLATTTKLGLRQVVVDMSNIATKALGPTSCYLSLYDWEYSQPIGALPDACDENTENGSQQLNVWDPVNDYDFGFL